MPRCIVCRKEVMPGECPVDIEACPNLCERKHIGVDIGNNDATAAAIISPTGELVGLVSMGQEAISFVRLHKEFHLQKLSFSCPPINSSGCSPSKVCRNDNCGQWVDNCDYPECMG